MLPRANFSSRRIHIAYFSMEIALRSEIHTYSGGLGILAGDTARSCADLEMPVVFVTLVSRLGYLRQGLDEQGRQVEMPDPWEPERWATPLGAKIAVEIEGREVWIRPWLYEQGGGTDFRVPVILLDTDLPENHSDDRRITDHLYGGDLTYRLKQEIVLGIGGIRLLRALGFEINTFHMNEGHSALLALDLLRRSQRDARTLEENGFDIGRVRDTCIFTTHTPVEAGHDRFPYELVQRLLGDFFEIGQLKALAGADSLNMTRLALSLSGFVNGVAKRHAETSTRMFPGYQVHAITNGVHAPTWAAPSFVRLYEAHFPDWRHEPEILVRADQLSDEEVWTAHQEAKHDLLAKVREMVGVTMDPDVPLIGFARRMTGYKRPDLLLYDAQRLAAVARRQPLQIVFAGKAHPGDEFGKRLIEQINRESAQLAGDIPIAYLPNYGMEVGRLLVSGCDIWLNTPLPPMEASGTSGMKAALNGILNLSVLDGWWVEACIEGTTGWAIGNGSADNAHGEDAADLYRKLEEIVLPLYYDDRPRWIWMMKQAIGKIAYYFNSHRMMRRYAAEAYIR